MYDFRFGPAEEHAEWSGTLHEFLTENEMSDEEEATLREQLDAVGFAMIGGGAMPTFTLRLNA